MNTKILAIAIVATVASYWANDISDEAYDRREAVVSECKAELPANDSYDEYDLCRSLYMDIKSAGKYAQAYKSADSRKDIADTTCVTFGFLAFFAFLAFAAPIVWRFFLARLAEVSAAIRGQ